MKRRESILFGVASLASSSAWAAQQPATEPSVRPIRPEPERGQRQELELVKAFVQAGHGDQNIAKVKEYLARDPKLIYATWDWGGGDWETALGGASHLAPA